MLKNKLRIDYGTLFGIAHKLVGSSPATAEEISIIRNIFQTHGFDAAEVPANVIIAERIELEEKEVKRVAVMTYNGQLHYFGFSAAENLNDWHLLGKYYGYPDCCIDAFIRGDYHAEEYPVPDGLPFLPCKKCAGNPVAELLIGVKENRFCKAGFDKKRHTRPEWVDVIGYYAFHYTRLEKYIDLRDEIFKLIVEKKAAKKNGLS